MYFSLWYAWNKNATLAIIQEQLEILRGGVLCYLTKLIGSLKWKL